MKMSVSPSNGTSVPLRAAVSSARTTVVPIATTRPPRALHAATALHEIGTHRDPLAVHTMCRQLLNTHRLKRSGADVQRQPRDRDTDRRAPIEQGLVEVQPGCRRRHRTTMLREHGCFTVDRFSL